MLKLLQKLSVRILIAVIFGFLLASYFTKLGYGCPAELNSGCIGGSKFAILHPNDLMNDPAERGNFMETFLAGSLVSFAVVSITVHVKPKT